MKHPTAKNVRRPNFLVVCSDQHRADFAGFAGHPTVRTPNLDRLAAHGRVFTGAYSTNPVCTPARAGLFTGRLPSRSNSFCNSTPWDGSQQTWGSRLRSAGYRTMACGKMDLDGRVDTGFEERGTSHGHAQSPDVTSLFRRPLACRWNERQGITGQAKENAHPREDEVLAAACDWLKVAAQSPDPWALYTGFHLPHPPFTARPDLFAEYLGKDPGVRDPDLGELEALHLVYQQMRHFKRVATPIDPQRVRAARAAYCAMVTELDERIGLLLDCLQATGQAADTVVVYTSDHGESLGEHGMWYKNNFFEGSARVPLVLRIPGELNGAMDTSPVSHTDLVATLLQLGGAGQGAAEGSCLLTTAPGNRVAVAETHSEGNCTGVYMVRKGRWKAVFFVYFEEEGGLLFDLEDDPDERVNRWSDPDCIEIRKGLYAELTSRLDPEAETERAFARQAAVLDSLTRNRSAGEVHKLLRARFGAGQARVMAATMGFR